MPLDNTFLQALQEMTRKLNGGSTQATASSPLSGIIEPSTFENAFQTSSLVPQEAPQALTPTGLPSTAISALKPPTPWGQQMPQSFPVSSPLQAIAPRNQQTVFGAPVDDFSRAMGTIAAAISPNSFGGRLGAAAVKMAEEDIARPQEELLKRMQLAEMGARIEDVQGRAEERAVKQRRQAEFASMIKGLGLSPIEEVVSLNDPNGLTAVLQNRSKSPGFKDVPVTPEILELVGIPPKFAGSITYGQLPIVSQAMKPPAPIRYEDWGYGQKRNPITGEIEKVPTAPRSSGGEGTSDRVTNRALNEIQKIDRALMVASGYQAAPEELSSDPRIAQIQALMTTPQKDPAAVRNFTNTLRKQREYWQSKVPQELQSPLTYSPEGNPPPATKKGKSAGRDVTKGIDYLRGSKTQEEFNRRIGILRKDYKWTEEELRRAHSAL